MIPKLENLNAEMFSADITVVRNASEMLGKIGGLDVLTFLVSLLDVDDVSIRNHVALALEQMKDDRALDPLLKAIFKTENHNSNGTLVFALSALNCSEYLIDIFRILLFETYESKLSAYSILQNQEFVVSDKDIFEITSLWNQRKLSPDICPGYDHDETREIMEHAVRQYTAKTKK